MRLHQTVIRILHIWIGNDSCNRLNKPAAYIPKEMVVPGMGIRFRRQEILPKRGCPSGNPVSIGGIILSRNHFIRQIRLAVLGQDMEKDSHSQSTRVHMITVLMNDFQQPLKGRRPFRLFKQTVIYCHGL